VQLADGDVEWVVQDGQGRPLPIYTMRGARDYQLAGRHGERYELVYSNRSQRHYEVVATVDGLDVLTGQAGSVHSAGYLLRPARPCASRVFARVSAKWRPFVLLARSAPMPAIPRLATRATWA
jgi:hypothetical protein